MVLEGHFITHSIQPQYRDDTNPIYAFWKFTRGLTAPLFLFISGLIFTYLLLKQNTQGTQNPRLKKGLKRGFILIGIGYLLQLNLYDFFFLDKSLFTDLFQIFHILQCIGTSLLFVIVCYLFNFYVLKTSLHRITLITGCAIFLFAPTLLHCNYSEIHRCVENIFITSKNNSIKTSVFPLFPWAGFVFMGATIGAVFQKYKNIAHSYQLPLVLFSIGWIINTFYYNLLTFLWWLTPFSWIQNFSAVYEFARLGQILMIFSTFIVLHKYKNVLAKPFRWIPWNNQLFIKIGQNTLSIFVFHVIILYQGFLGWNINELIRKKLTPWPAILGALLFITFFVFWVKYLEHIKQFPIKLYKNLYLIYLRRKRSRFYHRHMGVS